MIELDVPARLRGELLSEELAAAGVAVDVDGLLVHGGRLRVDAPESVRDTVEQVVAAHDPPGLEAPRDRLAELEDAVDTLILDALFR